MEADTVVFEFPFWWYSAPSLMRRYFELVLSHGFAYGSTGTALHGNLCGLDWQEPVISFGMMLLDPDDKEAADRFYAEVKSYTDRLANAVM
ncbi:MAG: NAD(P)H-dependent oxidoreductase [Muribaculaceae bacterium]|nr:NAD(P)H-dependent oxidoreductase [Muribaculaceae bacterium]